MAALPQRAPLQRAHGDRIYTEAPLQRADGDRIYTEVSLAFYELFDCDDAGKLNNYVVRAVGFDYGNANGTLQLTQPVHSFDDPVCVRSRTGYVLTLGGCPISWSSKLQTEIALSTTEAEFIALSQAMRELIPTRRLLTEISGYMRLQGDSPVLIKSTVFEDNNGAISTARAVKMTPRTKHIAVKYFFFKSHIGPDTGIELVKIDTLLQKANIFTKGMAPEKFVAMRKLLCGW